jgi:hypothetical protein
MRRRAILKMMRDKTNQSQQFFAHKWVQFVSIGPSCDHTLANPLHKARKKRFSAHNLPSISLLLLAPLAACNSPVVEESQEPPPPDSIKASGCGKNGALQTVLFGSLETSIGWSGSEMICENMLRPNNAGVRLRFAGDVAQERLAFIIALPTLQRGETAEELPSNVTTTVEGSGRFFSTPNLDSCWTDVESQTAISDDDDTYVTTGTLYCVTPLGEVNGEATVSIPELTFTTIIEWAQ